MNIWIFRVKASDSDFNFKSQPKKSNGTIQ